MSENTTSEKSFWRRHAGVIVLLLIVVALAVPKALSLRSRSAAPAAASPAEPVLTVDAYRVTPRRLEERLSTTGALRANEQVDLVSEIAGKVERIHFREGSRVGAGQLLVEIDAAELEAERERARYRVALAETEERRQRTLYEEGILSQQEYDLDLNQLNVYRSELALIEARLTKTEIRAPFAGTVGLRRVSEGSYLSPQTRIASLQDLSSIKIDFSLPERYAGEVAVGDQIDFRLKADESSYRARVYAIEPAVDAETRSLVLRAECPNPGRRLLPGSFADVELAVRVVEDALTVPAIAVIPELGGKKVFVFEDGRAEARPVETGLRMEDEIEVTAGLASGDVVLVSGLLELQDGLPVELAGEPAGGADPATAAASDEGEAPGGQASGETAP